MIYEITKNGKIVKMVEANSKIQAIARFINRGEEEVAHISLALADNSFTLTYENSEKKSFEIKGLHVP